MPGKAVLLAALLLAGAPAFAVNDPEPRSCELRHEVEFLQRRSDLPQDIQKALAELGTMAEAGEPYNATDAIDPAVPFFERFVLGGHVGDRWFVWYEQGGMSRTDHVVGWMPIRAGADKTKPFLAADFIGNPCKGIDAFLDGVIRNIYANDMPKIGG